MVHCVQPVTLVIDLDIDMFLAMKLNCWSRWPWYWR